MKSLALLLTVALAVALPGEALTLRAHRAEPAAGGPTQASVAEAVADKYVKTTTDEVKAAGDSAMKFTETMAQESAAGDFAPKVYKVAPGEKGGLAFKPSEGMNDPEVHVRARADYAEPVKQVTDYLGSHSYQEDLKALLVEVDKSQNFMKGLKLRIAEKENFIDSLVQREDMLQSDVNKDKQSLDNLHAHVKALRARIEKIKKTKQLGELQAQFNEYSAASDKLSAQAQQLSDVKNALEAKMSALKYERDALKTKEISDMKESLDVDNPQSTPLDGNPQEAPVAPVASPASPDASGPAGEAAASGPAGDEA